MNLLDKIKKNEGFRSTVYQCSEGYDTIGYGFAIKDLEIERDIADIILERKKEKLTKRIILALEWYNNSPEIVQDVVFEMCYQMGLSGFLQFKKTIYYLETEQYEEAAGEMLDSLWHKQAPSRSQELSDDIFSLA